MEQENTRLIVAVIICVAGGSVLVMSYRNTRPPNAQLNETEQEATQAVLESMDDSKFVEIPEGAQGDTLAHIRASIITQARGIDRVQNLGDASVKDLADAFAERVVAMYWPDFERDYSASQSRGDPVPRTDAESQYERYVSFLESQHWTPKVAMEDVEVSIIMIGVDGELNIRRDRFDDGFGISTGNRTKNRYPIVKDPVKAGYVSVEIVMPMYQYEVKSKSMKPAVVGYHFAWDMELGKWVPYESVVFNAPGLVFGVPLL